MEMISSQCEFPSLIKWHRYAIFSLLIMQNIYSISIPGRNLISQIPDIAETGSFLRIADITENLHQCGLADCIDAGS
jgi:hypothetical protein